MTSCEFVNAQYLEAVSDTLQPRSCRCRKREEDSYNYAVKELLLSSTPDGINSLKEVLREVEVLQALSKGRTCHVVKLHAFYRSKDTAWLVLE